MEAQPDVVGPDGPYVDPATLLSAGPQEAPEPPGVPADPPAPVEGPPADASVTTPSLGDAGSEPGVVPEGDGTTEA